MTDASARQEHLTDEELVVLADAGVRGGRVDTAGVDVAGLSAHAQGCLRCSRAVNATGRAARALATPVSVAQPPAHLWERIAADLDSDGRARVRGPAEPRTAAPGAPAAGDALAARRGTRGRQHGWAWPAVAAASLIVGMVLSGALTGGLPTERERQPQLVTLGSARLQPVGEGGFAASARMVDDHGRLELRVDVPQVPDPADGYYEIWLRDERARRMISLGAVTGTNTTVTVPAGVDLAEYAVVEVSHEHFDGDPSHGGTSLSAGAMDRATV